MATKGKTQRSNTTGRKAGKKAAKKVAAKESKRKVRSKPKASKAVSREERRRMIAEAAYKRAEIRRFQDADPVGDWLAAEREIDQKILTEAVI